MRIIDLNDIGIKIISVTKKQVYLTKSEIKSLVQGEFKIQNSILCLDNKKLSLSTTEIENLPYAISYIKKKYIND